MSLGSGQNEEGLDADTVAFMITDADIVSTSFSPSSVCWIPNDLVLMMVGEGKLLMSWVGVGGVLVQVKHSKTAGF